MTELPAGLRPRKQGVNWMRGMSVAAALMLLWAASMTVSFIANRELVAIAQEQVRQASAEKQSLTLRLHALSALQKTLSQLEYRSQHARGTSALASVRTMTCWRRCSRATERAQPLLRDAAAHHLEEQLTAFVQLPPDSPLREKMTKTAYGQLKQYLMLTRPENGRRVVRHHANAGLVAALRHRRRRLAGQRPFAAGIYAASGIASAVASACR
ncbi:hypothetical protein J4733_10720 [Klebsiella pneumoniae]|uniref:Uncharacterized protein n=1 Tax=Klebsiella pneumoniae TaxID=573 RepID=A0A939NNN1_KLEPN|nr:hypothetical protein [Klebsiella pneumoniae]